MNRKTLVTLGLLLVSSTMVYGTWLAVDDMRAKPLAATVRTQPGVVHIDNVGDYGWQEGQVTINGRFRSALPGVAAGQGADIAFDGFRDDAGRPADWSTELPRELSITVTRVPRFPLLNRARTASGTFPL